ncbi:MAG: hypothetical protein JNM46_07220 [Anaerolineales bacterium]|nr:hypothetical protein [Anaerolineales bacterium]
MNTPIEKVKKKRPSKGQARHNRRVKQEARKNAVPGVEVKKKRQPTSQAPK